MNIIAHISLQTPERLVLPGEKLEINDPDARSLIERGFASRVSGADEDEMAYISTEEPAVTLQEIVDAINVLGESDFSQDGKPLVKALENALERNITQEERDRAWAQVKKARAT